MGGVRENSALWQLYHLPQLLDGEGHLQGATPTNQVHPSDPALSQRPEGMVAYVGALWWRGREEPDGGYTTLRVCTLEECLKAMCPD